jgi:hypothetical protein
MELSTDEGKRLIDQIAGLKVPVFVLTGGDPIKRPDLLQPGKPPALPGRQSKFDSYGRPSQKLQT